MGITRRLAALEAAEESLEILRWLSGVMVG